MLEARASSSGGTLLPGDPLPSPVPPDVVDKLRECILRDCEETHAMLREQLEASGELADARNKNIRDELKLAKAEMDIEQAISCPSPPQRSQNFARCSHCRSANASPSCFPCNEIRYPTKDKQPIPRIWVPYGRPMDGGQRSMAPAGSSSEVEHDRERWIRESHPASRQNREQV